MLTECPMCGETLELVDQKGRSYEYRGGRYPAPEDMTVRTCKGCDSEWMGRDEIEKLSAHLEDQRKLAMAREMWPSTLKFRVNWMKHLLDGQPEDPPTPETKDD